MPTQIDVEGITETVTEEQAPVVQPQVLTSETVGGLAVESVTEAVKTVNILVYGYSGVGKTVLAGSASVVPEMSPVLFLDLEGGTLSLRHTYPDVKAIRVKSWSQLQSVYDDLIRGKTGYKTVVLDSISEFQRLSMDSLMYEVVKRESPGQVVTEQVAWGMDSADDRNLFVPSQREWGICLGQMRKFVRAFRDAPVNTIFTALAKQQQDKRSLRWMTSPSLQGQAGQELPGLLDEIFYYYIKRVGDENTRLLLTAQTDSEVAKDRSGTLPVVMQQPTMSEIYRLITEKGNA